MSMAELLTATRDSLRQAFDWGSNQCELTDDGKPFPMSPRLFVGLHPGPFVRDSHTNEALFVRFGIQITVSSQAPARPADKPFIWQQEFDPSRVMWRIICHLWDRRTAVFQAANTLINSESNKFVEPYFFTTATSPIDQPPSWWGRIDGTEENQARAVGQSVTARFDGALRAMGYPEKDEEGY